MKISNTISQAIIAAATGILQPFIPDLSPSKLVAALKAYDDNDSGNKPGECDIKPPMTIKSVCELLEISRPSVYRLKKTGKIRFIKIGSLTRIPAEDVERLLAGDDTA